MRSLGWFVFAALLCPFFIGCIQNLNSNGKSIDTYFDFSDNNSLKEKKRKETPEQGEEQKEVDPEDEPGNEVFSIFCYGVGGYGNYKTPNDLIKELNQNNELSCVKINDHLVKHGVGPCIECESTVYYTREDEDSGDDYSSDDASEDSEGSENSDDTSEDPDGVGGGSGDDSLDPVEDEIEEPVDPSKYFIVKELELNPLRSTNTKRFPTTFNRISVQPFTTGSSIEFAGQFAYASTTGNASVGRRHWISNIPAGQALAGKGNCSVRGAMYSNIPFTVGFKHYSYCRLDPNTQYYINSQLTMECPSYDTNRCATYRIIYANGK
jgi:hypothetical protein